MVLWVVAVVVGVVAVVVVVVSCCKINKYVKSIPTRALLKTPFELR